MYPPLLPTLLLAILSPTFAHPLPYSVPFTPHHVSAPTPRPSPPSPSFCSTSYTCQYVLTLLPDAITSTLSSLSTSARQAHTAQLVRAPRYGVARRWLRSREDENDEIRVSGPKVVERGEGEWKETASWLADHIAPQEFWSGVDVEEVPEDVLGSWRRESTRWLVERAIEGSIERWKRGEVTESTLPFGVGHGGDGVEVPEISQAAVFKEEARKVVQRLVDMKLSRAPSSSQAADSIDLSEYLSSIDSDSFVLPEMKDSRLASSASPSKPDLPWLALKEDEGEWIKRGGIRGTKIGGLCGMALEVGIWTVYALLGCLAVAICAEVHQIWIARRKGPEVAAVVGEKGGHERVAGQKDVEMLKEEKERQTEKKFLETHGLAKDEERLGEEYEGSWWG